jgi:hypothetical protein
VPAEIKAGVEGKLLGTTDADWNAETPKPIASESGC